MKQFVPKNVGRVSAVEVQPENEFELAQSFGAKLVETFGGSTDNVRVDANVPTLQGVIRASQGDFVYRGRDGITRVMGHNEFLEQFEETGLR
jgi:hypothetical protein